MSFGAGDRVLVTGAAGFVGSAVARALIARGVRVVALLQPGRPHKGVDGLEVERVVADLRDGVECAKAVEGCRAVFHVAALYRFWSGDPAEFYDVNVGGTLNILTAARAAGCERIVYTSTVGTLGVEDARRGGAALVDERRYAHVDHLFGSYKQSKYVAEHEVLREAANGLPVVLIQPTFPVGPRDHGPTPSGKMILDFLNGKMPAYVDTSLNVVDVEDVAAGQLLAAEKGAIGRSYILGGENLPMRDILRTLAEITGLPAPSVQVPRGFVMMAARLSQLVEGRLLRREPSVPVEGVRMAATRMEFSDARARSELGYTSRPPREALERSARWYAENGYVRPRRLEQISWASAANVSDVSGYGAAPHGAPVTTTRRPRR
jgi:dihydroflavonol-4-reductase